jgi:hypothetical protein
VRTSKLKNAAVTIGAAAGKADRTAHRVAEASVIARNELTALMKQVESLKKQLEKSSARLRRALNK